MMRFMGETVSEEEIQVKIIVMIAKVIVILSDDC